MITIYKATPSRLMEIDEYEEGSWVNVSEPSRHELDILAQRLGIPQDFLVDPLDVDEVARIEVEGESLLIVLRIPKYDRENADIPFSTLPIGIIFTKGLIITVCLENVEILLDFINGNIKSFSMENRTLFFLKLLHRAVFLFLKYLKEINKRTNAVETELHMAMKNEELIKLLNLEKGLVFFTTSLRSNGLMMERLQRVEYVKMNSEEKDLLEDAIIDNRQAIEMADIYSNILSGMMDAFASIISNNLNVVIKVLTSITIIVALPTLIVSAYGMNINLPFQGRPQAFFIIMGFSLILSGFITLLFMRRKWF